MKKYEENEMSYLIGKPGGLLLARRSDDATPSAGKAEGPDARRKAHDVKEKGAPDRTKKEIDEDYKINR